MDPRREIDGSGVERIRDATDQPRAYLQVVERDDVSHELVCGFRGHWPKMFRAVRSMASRVKMFADSCAPFGGLAFSARSGLRLCKSAKKQGPCSYNLLMTTAIIATKTPAAIRVHSMAVAPEQSFKKGTT